MSRPNGKSATVRVNGDRVAARTVVGADGINGVSARALELGGNQAVGVALEGNLSYGRIDRERFRGRLLIDFATVPGGYAWVFPKGDHVNFGVGGSTEEGPRLREHLRRLCERHGAELEELGELRGFRLPMRPPSSLPLARPCAARRGCRRPRRPGVRRRDVRGDPRAVRSRQEPSWTCSRAGRRRSTPTVPGSRASSRPCSGPPGASRRRSTASPARPSRSRRPSSSGMSSSGSSRETSPTCA